MAERKDVMISSTSVDLPEYRKVILEACQKTGCHGVWMEDLHAHEATAVTASLAMVDKADIYLGIFAHRYGFIPKDNNPDKISITEMEYNRAVRRGIPRVIFVIDDSQPVLPKDIDRGRAAQKLKKLLVRLQGENIVNFFTTPENLKSKAIHSLGEELKKFEVSPTIENNESGIRSIPSPPQEYVAHPYLLFQTQELIGRRAELDLLNEWVSDPRSDIYKRHIFSFVAIGGLGKSALTWKWFNEIAPEKMKPLAGRIWWSFYDRDSYFENFVIHALAYISDATIDAIRRIPPPEREAKLLFALNQNDYLLVLDGFERELDAYSRIDLADMNDSEVGIQKGSRKTIDPRVGQFLKKLAQVKKSRILISTRLQPRALENEVDDSLPGVFRFDLGSLLDEDAIRLWKALGVDGSRNVLLPLFRQFDKHTILIQAVAGEVKRFRPAPGDLEKWLIENPKFEPNSHPKIKERAAHVIEFALQGLSETERNILAIIVAFRFPQPYATLAGIFTSIGHLAASETELGEILSDLENRGLVGWDKRANRYDLHPIVRGVVWGSLEERARQRVYTNLFTYFESGPMIEDWQNVQSLEDLMPAIEIYYALIGMNRFEEAFIVFYKNLSDATVYRLSEDRQRTEMLEMLFPDGLEQLPRLTRQDAQSYTLNSLAMSYHNSGQLDSAISFYQRANEIDIERGSGEGLSTGLRNLSMILWSVGKLRESEVVARQSLDIERQNLVTNFNEGVSLLRLGFTFATTGKMDWSRLALQRSLRIFSEENSFQGLGVANAYLAEWAVCLSENNEALFFANHAWELADAQRVEIDFVRAARLLGEAHLGLRALEKADEWLHQALIRSKAVNFVEEELSTLTALAELRKEQGDEKAAREYLDDIWEYAERGPYPLYHADALNVLAQIERDAGNTDEAIEAATKAYRLAWCDGPPYAYHWGLVKAQKHLEELEAPLPDMPAFDESKYEPMPEVEIDPEDEFHVGEESS